MRADRLMQILLQLQHKGKVTARELAVQLEVSERTIHRDMEALSAAGIPILADRGTGGGWYLHSGYKTALTGINRSDIEALLLPELASRGIHSSWSESFAKASQKLLAALPADWRKQAEDVRRRIHVDGAGWHAAKSSGESEAVLSALQEAVWAGRKAVFAYMRDGSEGDRTVSPYGLVVKGTVWYLVGAAEGKGASGTAETGSDAEPPIRSYRVSRIASVRMLDEAVTEPPPGFNLADYWNASVVRFKEQLPAYRAVLRSGREGLAALRNTRYVQVEEAKETLQGTITVHARFDTLESAVSIILGLAGKVIVLEPGELIQGVRDAAWQVWNDHGPSD